VCAQVTAEGCYTGLCTYLETLLTMVWYPTTVATLSRRIRDSIEAAFERSVDGGAAHPALPSRVHDFGCRGCTCVEQAVIGGSAHLLSFEGTDTLPAAFYTAAARNGGAPTAHSIPATEHSAMMASRSEREAFERAIQRYGSGTLSVLVRRSMRVACDALAMQLRTCS
jgi:nicotinamide phosphoribosyltransferase